MKIKNGFFFLLEKIVKIFSVTFDHMYVPKYVQSDIILKLSLVINSLINI